MAKRYKNYQLNSKDDYLYVLYMLIVQVKTQLDKYKKYNDELMEYIHEKNSNIENYIDKYAYYTFTDKIHDTSMSIIKCLADQQDTSMSYLMFRKIIDKKRSLYNLDNLSEEISNHLKELRDVRNWSFHNAQSNFVASKEYVIKQVPNELRKPEYFKYNFNPIIIEDYQNYDIRHFISLYFHTDKRINIYDKILDQMIIDFEKIYGENITIEVKKIENPKEFFDADYTIAQLSMAMQRDYDGSDKKYNELFIKKRQQ